MTHFVLWIVVISFIAYVAGVYVGARLNQKNTIAGLMEEEVVNYKNCIIDDYLNKIQSFLDVNKDIIESNSEAHDPYVDLKPGKYTIVRTNLKTIQIIATFNWKRRKVEVYFKYFNGEDAASAKGKVSFKEHSIDEFTLGEIITEFNSGLAELQKK